ncbi:MAG: sulfurtransferase [Geminicoccaceae bacterium]
MRLSIPSICGFATLLVTLAGPAIASELEPLVDVDWVKANADREDVVLLDIRNEIDGGSAEAFIQGHVPGAVYSDYLKDGWRTKVDGVIGQAPKADQLEALIGGLGIDNDTTVVVIPAGVSSTDFGSAARVYWTFNYVGHDEVAILDGGYRAWTADSSNPIETGPSTPEIKIFEAELRPELRVDGQAVEAALGDPGKLLLDGRPEKQFAGLEKHDAAKAAGHIPGATHFDQAQTFDKNTGKLVDLAKLESLLPAGLGDAEDVYSYCNTGHWAAVNWFVLSEVIGKDNVKLYDGSMVDWTQNPAHPLEK